MLSNEIGDATAIRGKCPGGILSHGPTRCNNSVEKEASDPQLARNLADHKQIEMGTDVEKKGEEEEDNLLGPQQAQNDEQ